MKKMLFVSLLFLATACVSTSDIATLQSQIDSLKADQTSLVKEVAVCKDKMAVAVEDKAKCELHCKNFESKLDKVFKKSQHK